MRRFAPILKTATIAAVVFIIFSKAQGSGVPSVPKLNLGA